MQKNQVYQGNNCFFLFSSINNAFNGRFDEMRHPYIGDLTSNQSVQNYCFPSRLGADIRVTELMFEPKIGFFFPKQLL